MKHTNTALSHPSFFNRYVDMVDEGSIIELLEMSISELKSDLESLLNSDFNYAYALDKWQIKTLIRHCIDAEIIFISRALSIARNDIAPIRSFNENDYAAESIAEYDKIELTKEFLNIRNSSIYLFKGFKNEWLSSRKGTTDKGETITLISIAYIIIGHWRHHKKILTEKYGVKF